MNKKKCQYCGATENLENGKKTPISGIIRTKEVCNKCFTMFKKDNQKRQAKGMSIPNSFSILRI